jgi:murein DD-endopeptidase MepM/ murein hydrolase activator NlpD
VLFVLSLAGFFLSSLLVHLLLPDQAPQLLILTGLNSVLVAVALGGSLVIPARKSLVLALLAVMMTVIFTGVFVRLLGASHLPVMVLPFNIIVLGTLYSLKFRQSASGLVLLYFPPGSPEENCYYHHTAQARFEKLRFRLFDLPFAGEWTVSQGHGGKTTHRGDWRHAWDFVVAGEDGRTYADNGSRLEDYHCYRLPVRAPDDGTVALVVDNVPNNPIGAVNLTRNWGNTIILKHADGLYSSLSHLEPNSAKVTVGQVVTRGDILALCGSSGRSPEPHLHVQFQASAHLGDVTLPYPLGVFARKQTAGFALCTSEIPAEGDRVQNLKPHRQLQQAFAFALGDTLRFACRFGADNDTVIETWHVKVDIFNSLYIESSAGAWVSVLATDSVVYLTGFRGRQHSALYYFYLSAAQLPLGHHPGLAWQDSLPLGKVLRSWVRPLSELFLLLGTPLRADVGYRFETGGEHDGVPVIGSELRISGRGPFRAVRKTSRGRVRISSGGEIAGMEYQRRGQTVFTARRIEDQDDESPATIASPVLEETHE